MTAPRAGQRTLTFEVLGFRFTVVADSATAAAALRRLYGDEAAAAHPDTLPVFQLCAEDTARRWRLWVPGAAPQAHPSLTGALRHLDYEVCCRTMAQRTDLLWLHGALLQTSDGGVLISGPSGAGKSTLTLGLLALGYPVGGDDVAFVEPASGLVRAFPRFLHTDRRGRRLLHQAGWWPRAARCRAGALLPSRLGTAIGPVRAILFKEPPVNDPPHLTPIPQAEAAVRLLPQARAGGLPRAAVIAALQRLAAGAACLRVSGGGGSEHLPALIAAVTAALGPPPKGQGLEVAA